MIDASMGGWHTQPVPRDRDVGAFNDRAGGYEGGWLGRMHRDIAVRTADVAVTIGDAPPRVLDVGCGTGMLLRLLAARWPEAQELVGIDAASGMIEVAESKADDSRLRFCNGVAEDLPFPDESFDLVVSVTSFDHWKNQRVGLGECARVLTPGRQLVLTDLFSALLVPTLLTGRRDRARTKHRAATLLQGAGFRDSTWRSSYSLIIGTVVASK
jgi:ubiquinone/menaquinone biosynthesis C-methylase UbiE